MTDEKYPNYEKYRDKFLGENTGLDTIYSDPESQGLIAQVNAARMADDPENEKAYDGSNNPAKRELTARERDILVRLINDVLNHKRHHAPVWVEDGEPFGYWEFTPVPITISEGFFHILWKIREAIDPRD